VTDDTFPEMQEIVDDIDGAILAAKTAGRLTAEAANEDVVYLLLTLYMGFVSERLSTDAAVALLDVMFQAVNDVLTGNVDVTPE
jgi:hypothetical protein